VGKDKEFFPEWYHKTAPENSYRSIFRWGYPHLFKHPNKRLYRLLKQVFAMTDDDFQKPSDLGEEIVSFNVPVNLSSQQLDNLRLIAGKENVRTDDYSRLRAAYGKMIYDLMRLRKKMVENLPDAVVCPRDKADVRSLVRYCHLQKIPVTAYGGCSSVMRGTECPRGGISLDMQAHMNRIIALNIQNQTVTVEPGILGPDLEDALNGAPKLFGTKLRYTCGHLPQSFHSSTAGGWIVTRGAGQNSTYFYRQDGNAGIPGISGRCYQQYQAGRRRAQPPPRHRQDAGTLV
jgi:alkyldihydroxyacetonephosphate synthase